MRGLLRLRLGPSTKSRLFKKSSDVFSSCFLPFGPGVVSVCAVIVVTMFLLHPCALVYIQMRNMTNPVHSKNISSF